MADDFGPGFRRDALVPHRHALERESRPVARRRTFRSDPPRGVSFAQMRMGMPGFAGAALSWG